MELTPLSDQVEEAIKQQILSGEMKPGQRLDIAEYSVKWNISTTPIRDALRRLESNGLVEISARRGVFVSRMDFKRFKDIFEVRIALECSATNTATHTIPDTDIEKAIAAFDQGYQHLLNTGDRSVLAEQDDLVHTLVIHHCGNDLLQKMMDGLHDQIAWARKTIVTREPRSYEEAYFEHVEILKAIQKRDAERAVHLMREHLQNAFKRLAPAQP